MHHIITSPLWQWQPGPLAGYSLDASMHGGNSQELFIPVVGVTPTSCWVQTDADYGYFVPASPETAGARELLVLGEDSFGIRLSASSGQLVIFGSGESREVDTTRRALVFAGHTVPNSEGTDLIPGDSTGKVLAIWGKQEAAGFVAAAVAILEPEQTLAFGKYDPKGTEGIVDAGKGKTALVGVWLYTWEPPILKVELFSPKEWKAYLALSEEMLAL